MVSYQEARHWVVNNQLKAVGSLWAGGLATSLAYQWTRPIPTQLKIIHSRVYAQALTLGALGLVAVAKMGEDKEEQHRGQPEL